MEFELMSKTWKAIIISCLFYILVSISINCASPSQQYIDLNNKLIEVHENTVKQWIEDRAETAKIVDSVKNQVIDSEAPKIKQDAILRSLSEIKEAIDLVVIDTINKSMEELKAANIEAKK